MSDGATVSDIQPKLEEMGIRMDDVIAIAQKAGDMAMQYQKDGLTSIEEKSMQDHVTEADLAVEEYLRSALFSLNDSIGFLGEESGETKSASGHCWIVDPIDGTGNYWRGLNDWAVSIALFAEGKPVAGVVHDAVHSKTFSAVRGQGAYLNGRKITVSRETDLSRCLVIVGISSRTPFETYLELLRNLNALNIEHRRFGSAALGLAQVAEGIVEGYWEDHLNIWDMAAGVLIAREAGALCTSMDRSMEAGGPMAALSPAIAPHLRPLIGNSP
jgi:myo-inositol-1(or 4)-monophosphatase